MTKAVPGEHAETNGLMAERPADGRRRRCGCVMSWELVSMSGISRCGGNLRKKYIIYPTFFLYVLLGLLINDLRFVKLPRWQTSFLQFLIYYLVT